MKRIVITVLCACVMVAVLCACGSVTYTLIAYDYDGFVIASDSMTSVLTLRDGGSGTMEVNGSSGRITWTEEDGNLVIHAGSESLSGTLRDGIATVDFSDGSRMYYAVDGADTSSLNVMTFEDYVLGTLR